MNTFFMIVCSAYIPMTIVLASAPSMNDQIPSFNVACTVATHKKMKLEQMVYHTLAKKRYIQMRDAVSQLTAEQMRHAKTKKNNVKQYAHLNDKHVKELAELKANSLKGLKIIACIEQENKKLKDAIERMQKNIIKANDIDVDSSDKVVARNKTEKDILLQKSDGDCQDSEFKFICNNVLHTNLAFKSLVYRACAQTHKNRINQLQDQLSSERKAHLQTQKAWIEICGQNPCDQQSYILEFFKRDAIDMLIQLTELKQKNQYYKSQLRRLYQNKR